MIQSSVSIPRTVLAALLSALCAVANVAHAAPKCLASDNPCTPNELCTFKAQLAEKVFLYQAYLRNSQVTKRMGKRDGVRYDGTMYNESISEARSSFPDDSAAEQKVKAGQIFQEKMRKHAQDKFKLPACSSGTLDKSLLPKAGYGGMFTDERCRIRVNYNGGDYDPEGFGSSDATSCQEFYDRDQAHEVIHQRSCERAAKKGTDLHSIDVTIEDEVASYKHSVKLSQAYVRLLSVQCSSEPDPDKLKARTKRLQDLLGPYLKKGG
jgi:hypothetical protein